MEKPKKLIINVSTGEEEYRDYTDEEMIQYEKDMAELAKMEAERLEKEQAQAEAKESANAKLAALGLSEAEISAILGK